MKKILAAVGLLIGACSVGHAAPAVQNVGATSTGTIITINVSTVPQLAVYPSSNVFNASGFQISLGTGTDRRYNSLLNNRIQMEIFNDSSVDIWAGFNSSVSSWTNSNNYGRRIPAGTAWSHDCSIEQHWLVAGSSTGFRVVITQEK